ncbi:MAG: rhomboid family intramembrane serine protease [Planctomycetes bacterium]|nr:rhomboid family intramembrane serine protease [Planctomycetota bacterium]
MKDLLQHADEMPVTLVVAIAYGTLAVVTKMFGPAEQFAENLHRFGMLTPQLVTAGEPWRLLTYAFLHGNALHLVFNLMMLFGIGPQLERTLGSVRFAALYVVTAVGGGLMVCLTQPFQQAVVGGSGALFGMLGCAVALLMRSGRHSFAFLEFEGPRRLMAMIVANLVIGFLLPFVSNSGHIGGLLTGFAFTLFWLAPGRQRSPLRLAWRAVVLLLFVSAGFASLVPVTRADYLAGAALAAQGERREQLERAFFEVTTRR